MQRRLSDRDIGTAIVRDLLSRHQLDTEMVLDAQRRIKKKNESELRVTNGRWRCVP